MAKYKVTISFTTTVEASCADEAYCIAECEQDDLELTSRRETLTLEEFNKFDVQVEAV
jgi:hypothetical protein